MQDQLPKNTQPLSKFLPNLSPEERSVVEQEKKYYYLVVALREKRKQLKMTQTQLAKAADLPRETITRIESGRRNVTLDTLMAIATALGSSLSIKIT